MTLDKHSQEISELLNSLNSPFSLARWATDPGGQGTIVVDYTEGGKRVFSVTFANVNRNTLDASRFIANSIQLLLEDIWWDQQDQDYIVSTSGFVDACQRVISRNQDVAAKVGLSVELQR